MLGKAFVRALQNEIRASQQAAQSRAGTRSTTEGTATNAITGMTLKVRYLLKGFIRFVCVT